MTTIRAAGLNAAKGDVTNLDLERPRACRHNEVLIEVRAAGVGHWDELMRIGGWPSGLTLPHALGVEAAGIVVDTGSGVSADYKGAAVLTHTFPFAQGGAWAENLLAPVGLVAIKPPNISWQVAASLPVPTLTADQVASSLETGLDGTVLVYGAGGVTGGLIVQILSLRGFSVIAVAGSNSLPHLALNGAAHVINRHDSDWRSQVREAAGGPAAGAVSATPGGVAVVEPLVARSARVVSIAGPASQSDRVDVCDVVVRADGNRLAELVSHFATGELAAPAVAAYPLIEAQQTLDSVVAGGHGKAMILEL